MGRGGGGGGGGGGGEMFGSRLIISNRGALAIEIVLDSRDSRC